MIVSCVMTLLSGAGSISPTIDENFAAIRQSPLNFALVRVIDTGRAE
jgi:hypothetical protein